MLKSLIHIFILVIIVSFVAFTVVIMQEVPDTDLHLEDYEKRQTDFLINFLKTHASYYGVEKLSNESSVASPNKYLDAMIDYYAQ